MAIANETIDRRPNSVEFAFGRVWYSVNSTVYVSQLNEGDNVDAIDKCYSVNDPTSGELSDPLDTDGFTVSIEDAGYILKLQKFRNGVLVLATEGVWYVNSGGNSFSSTSFSVDRLTTAGCISAESVVPVEDSVYYWSDEGIYVIFFNENGVLSVNNLVDGRIQSFYSEIPKVGKELVYGRYKPLNKEVEWIYPQANNPIPEAKTRGITLNLQTGGFFPLQYATDISIGGSSECLVGIAPTNIQTEEKEVAYVDFSFTITGSPKLKLAYRDDTTFTDWSGINANYQTYIETAEETLGKPHNTKRSPYIVMSFLKTETGFQTDGNGDLVLKNPSSCLMKAMWDWNITDAGHRWSPQQQLYRFRGSYLPTGPSDLFDTGESIITTKTKVAGRGKAMSMRLDAEDGKDMQILGWTIQWAVKGRL
jgi:hypothetical protein